MGIAQTLDTVFLENTADPARVESFLRSALREPFNEIQEITVRKILQPEHIYLSSMIFDYYLSLSEETRKIVIENQSPLMPYVRVALASKEEAVRVAACEFLKTLADPNSAELLTSMLSDSSRKVQDTVLEALEWLVNLYLDHVTRVENEENIAARQYVEDKRASMIRTLSILMTNFNLHKTELFVEALVRLYRDSYSIIVKILLHHKYEPVYRVLCHRLATRAHAELLFRLLTDRNADVNDVAVEILKKRLDATFAHDAAFYLDSLPEDEFQHLAARLKEIYWWEGVRQAVLLEREAGSYINLILKGSISQNLRHTYFLHFFESPHAPIRQQALESLKTMDVPDLHALCEKALNDSNDSVKLHAGMILIQANPRDKVKIFSQLLHVIQDDAIRKSIMKELAKGSFERYIQSFDRLDPQTRQSAARAIAKIDDDMVDKLTEEVHALDPARRLKALQIIKLADMGGELRSAIMEVLQDPDRRIRSAGIKLIGLTAGAEAIKILMEALSDPDRRIRANAIETFEEIKDPRYSSLLLPFVKDPDNRVRANAVKALWTMGHREVTSVLEEMLVDPDETMRLSAVWAIGEIRFEGAAQVLKTAMARETSPKVWTKIEETLKGME